MLGRVCAVLALAALLVPAPSLPVVEDAAATAIFTKHLRTYGFEGIKVTQGSLLLSTAESYPAYYWVVEAGPVATIAGEPQDGVTGYLEVKRVGTNDLICRGPVAEYNEIHKHQICSDLRVGHQYIVTYVLSTPSELLLYGHTP